MLILDEIIKQLGDVEYLRESKNVRLLKEQATFFLEYQEFGPMGGLVLRLVYSSEREEVEMHFEKRALCWLPYYLRDSKTEVFLYEFVDARQPLKLDFDAGSYLIQRACFLELILRAHGFDRLDHDELYHPLFTRRAS
jgi:hypothetical protein